MVATLREPDGGGAALASEITRRMNIAFGGANLVGGALVIACIFWVVPLPVSRGYALRYNLPLAISYLVVGSVLGPLFGPRSARPVNAWMKADRPPNEQELQVTLRQPLLQARNVAVLWLIGGLLLGGFNTFRSGRLALDVVVTILMGAIVTSALCYLMAERIGRPIVALALNVSPPTRPALPGVTARMVLAWWCGTGVATLGAALVAAEFLAGKHGPGENSLATTVRFLSIIGLVAGLATAAFAASSVADPLRSIRLALAEVERGNTNAVVPVNDGSEVGLLQAGFNSMAGGLRERERIRDLFGRHVGEDVARQALGSGIELGGESRDPVNEASRLTDLAKGQPERVLASEAVLSRATAAEAARWTLGDEVTLRGRPRPTRTAVPQ